MLCSMGTAVFATTDYSNGTDVTYNPADPDGIPNSGDEVDLEAYTITVPATLKPNQSGTVTLTGTWASNRIVTVTSDTSVELTNSIDANNKKTLTVTFAGISEAGSNTEAQTFTETVAVGEITNALFGTWTGHFSYNVDIANNGGVTFEPKSDLSDYTWAEIQAIAMYDTVNLAEYGIEPGDTITDEGVTYTYVSDERLEAYNGLVFMFESDTMAVMNPDYQEYSWGSSCGGYGNAVVKPYVDELYDYLDNKELKAVIRKVTVVHNDGEFEADAVTPAPHEPNYVDVYMFLPAVRELSGTENYYEGIENYEVLTAALNAEGNTFDYFVDADTEVENRMNLFKTQTRVWLRTMDGKTSNFAYSLYCDGTIEACNTTPEYTLMPAFVIGESNYVEEPLATEPKATLADYTWSEIKAISQSKDKLSVYNIQIGDSISDGTYTYYLVSDERREDYGGLVFMYKANKSSAMNSQFPPPVNTGGYLGSECKPFVDNLLFALPEDLQFVIKPVYIRATDGSAGSDPIIEATEPVKLFLPALMEISAYDTGNAVANAYLKSEGETFDLFTGEDSDYYRFLVGGMMYWTRSAETSSTASFWQIASQGSVSNMRANQSMPLVPVFVI